eukprot:5082739-Prymnesium_polylepis.1
MPGVGLSVRIVFFFFFLRSHLNLRHTTHMQGSHTRSLPLCVGRARTGRAPLLKLSRAHGGSHNAPHQEMSQPSHPMDPSCT